MTETTIPSEALENVRHVAEMLKEASVHARDRAIVRHERFNVFTTLLKEHDERRLHTRFIHCLLDPNGLHDCGSRFFDLFFETLAERPGTNHEDVATGFHCPSFSNPWTVEKEASRSPYGQIDILIEQPALFGIAIENKIHAGELDKQLESYGNYLREKFGNHALLIFLTLDGKRSETYKEAVQCLRISYADHILPWLDKCLWETCDIVPINQVLLQYREVVRNLTGKTVASDIMNQITKFIKANPDIIRFKAQINSAIDAARADFLDRLSEGIIAELKAEGYTVDRHSNLSKLGGALIIFPLVTSELHRLPIKIWVENFHSIIVGIKFPAGSYKKAGLTNEQQRVLETMNLFLNQYPEAQESRNPSPNEAWPVGWRYLIDPSNDDQLANVINVDPAHTASEICDAIYSHIDLLDRAYAAAGSLPPP